MILYLTLALCAIGMGYQAYRYDLYDREPLRAVLVAIALGMLMMWVAGRVQVGVMTALGPYAAGSWNTVMAAVAGLTEEAAKLSVVVFIALVSRRWFNDPMDGIVYGSFAGLGAAIEESISLLGFPGPSEYLPAQEPVRLMGHLVMGGIGGFGVGFLRFSPRWPLLLIGGFAFAALIHALWDVIAFDAGDRGRMAPWHIAGSVIIMAAGFVAYRWMVLKAGGRSRDVFAAASTDSPT